MNYKKYKQIENLFINNNGYLTTKKFLENGFSNYYLSELIKEGLVIKIKRGLFRWKEFFPTRNYEMIDVAKIVPMGIFCLWSSFDYYKIGSSPSRFYYLAIDNQKSHKPKLPIYPPIRFKYFTGKYFSVGIENIKLYNLYDIKIYNMEKTICDFIRLKKTTKLKNALIDYLDRPESNIVKLIEYSTTLGVSKTLRNYLSMLL